MRRMRSWRIPGAGIREMGGREHGRDLHFHRVESVMYATTHEPTMDWDHKPVHSFKAMRIAAKLWDCIAGGPETVIHVHRLQSGLPLDCFFCYFHRHHMLRSTSWAHPLPYDHNTCYCAQPTNFFNSPKSLSAISWKTRRTSS